MSSLFIIINTYKEFVVITQICKSVLYISSENSLKGNKMKESYVLPIVQLLKQLKNASSCITNDYQEFSIKFF